MVGQRFMEVMLCSREIKGLHWQRCPGVTTGAKRSFRRSGNATQCDKTDLRRSSADASDFESKRPPGIDFRKENSA